jgi:hypothetical protein
MLALGASAAPVAVGGPHAKDPMRGGPGEQASQRAGATIVRVSDRSGFDWADAGVGAAGGAALSMLGVGLVLLTRSPSHPST